MVRKRLFLRILLSRVDLESQRRAIQGVRAACEGTYDMGTLSERKWPDASQLPEFKPDFAVYPLRDLRRLFPSWILSGLTCCVVFCRCDQSGGSAADALRHPWFDTSLPKTGPSPDSAGQI
ncbi:CMGC/CDK/CDK5 protein kinase [Aspergillus terreus]|uniref:CMGC/CDK/CDK5 protein kinase n=1 Tax=Aspergillus terreus TaxID=33178 RepID=A0A5M3YZT1_ASPTE|nr:hypothetical protein ATETN484_0006047400 [Aspergillus terreus]GFF11936.1 CMGC/CDK/CDK5 protein kinase [Aspergillus terreus]